MKKGSVQKRGNIGVRLPSLERPARKAGVGKLAGKQSPTLNFPYVIRVAHCA